MNKVVAFFFFVFACCSVLADEAYVDTNNEQHVAQQRAMDYLRKEIGCAWTKTVRREGFKVYADVEGRKAVIYGNELEVRCVEVPKVSLKKWLLTWVEPTTRTNGLPLLSSEIKGYNIYLNDVFYKIVVGSSYLTEDFKAGDKIGLQTLDTNGLKSVVVDIVLEGA